MIYGIMSDNSIPALDFAANAPANAKVALPVAPSSLVYSHFKHINGIPAPEGSQGVTISKLNILDVLIDQMNQINSPAARPGPGTPESRLDAMIDSYRDKILEANENKKFLPYTPVPITETGSLFSFSV